MGNYYIKRPVCEAVQVVSANEAALETLVGADGAYVGSPVSMDMTSGDLAGMTVPENDWIVKAPNGEYSALNDAQFTDEFEAV